MQQLFDAFGVNWSLLLAQAVNFGIVLLALWYFLYRPLSNTLEKRRETIAKGVADAEAAAQLRAGADEKAAQRLLNAETEAQGIVGAAREAAGAERSRILTDAQARADAALKDAQARAEEAAAKMRRESEKDVARAAVLAAEKLLQKRHD